MRPEDAAADDEVIQGAEFAQDFTPILQQTGLQQHALFDPVIASQQLFQAAGAVFRTLNLGQEAQPAHVDAEHRHALFGADSARRAASPPSPPIAMTTSTSATADCTSSFVPDRAQPGLDPATPQISSDITGDWMGVGLAPGAPGFRCV